MHIDQAILSPKKFCWSALLISGLVYLFSFFYFAQHQSGLQINGDQWGYYAYLPAGILYGELCEMTETYNQKVGYSWGEKIDHHSELPAGEAIFLMENGKVLNKYTIGVALNNLPFFLLAHVITGFTELPSDGYSIVYQFCHFLGTMIYALLGLWIMSIALRKYFQGWPLFFSILTVGIGTNLYAFSATHGGMSHPYLFFYYAVLIYSVADWYGKGNWLSAIGIGISIGMISLIRPTELIAVLIPLLFGVSSFQSLKVRLRWLSDHRGQLLLAIGFALLMGLPQLIYWKCCAGDWLFYSYGNEGFNFLKPKILKGLFYFTNGWLAYTPLMSFSLVGFFWFRKHPAFLSTLVFIGLHIYIIYSWWCYNYINGFGSRPMVETYAVLAFPLTAFYEAIWKRRILRIGLATIIFLGIALNIHQTWQWKVGLLWSEAANGPFAWNILGQDYLTADQLILYDCGVVQPKEKESMDCSLLSKIDFKTDSTDYRLLSSTDRQSETISIALTDSMEGKWIKLSGVYLAEQAAFDLYSKSKLILDIKRGNYTLDYRYIRIENKLQPKNVSIWDGKTGVWDTVSFYAKLPHSIKEEDMLNVYTWNYQGHPIRMKSMWVESCEAP